MRLNPMTEFLPHYQPHGTEALILCRVIIPVSGIIVQMLENAHYEPVDRKWLAKFDLFRIMLCKIVERYHYQKLNSRYPSRFDEGFTREVFDNSTFATQDSSHNSSTVIIGPWFSPIIASVICITRCEGMSTLIRSGLKFDGIFMLE